MSLENAGIGPIIQWQIIDFPLAMDGPDTIQTKRPGLKPVNSQQITDVFELENTY
jgi:hypothetical protein